MRLKKPLIAFLLTLLFFLVQACVAPYLRLGQVVGSVLLAWLAIVVVSLGRKYAFCASAIIGMLMEVSVGSLTALYVVAYPAITMLAAQFFADMTDRARERRRTVDNKRRQDDLPALLRIPLCAAMMCAVLETVNLIYVYLAGTPLTFSHIARALLCMTLTVALSLLLMLPCRRLLGMYASRLKPSKGGELP